MKIVLATNNAGKVKELTSILAPLNIAVIPQSELGITEAKETGVTFIENALIKARHAARLANMPAIADDSGLVVPALQGAPGIYSARYAGDHANAALNIQKLLAELKNTSEDQRHARFHCTLVFLQHENDPTPVVCDGDWEGIILHEPVGTEGFGYDPVFFDPHEKKSAAELPLAIKNSISHRGKALQKLLTTLSGNT